MLEVPAEGQTVAASCQFLKGGYASGGRIFPPVDTGAGLPSAMAFEKALSKSAMCSSRISRQTSGPASGIRRLNIDINDFYFLDMSGMGWCGLAGNSGWRVEGKLINRGTET